MAQEAPAPKKLHLGCGSKIIPGFINIDLHYSPGVDLSNHDVSDLGCFETASVELIYASHVLEHIPRPRTFNTLLEWNRVLKPGGVLRLGVPDWDATVKVYQETGDFENLLNWIFGGGEYPGNFHFRLFTFSGLKTLLIEAGFKRVTRYDWRTVEHAAIDDYSKAYIPHMDFDNGTLLSLNVECVKHLYPPDFQ